MELQINTRIGSQFWIERDPARHGMTLLRILLLLILLYYGIRLLVRWIFRPDSGRIHGDKKERTSGGDKRYRNLTDQSIEDADYEEIDTSEKP